VPIDELIPAESERAALQSQLASLIGSYRRTLETDRGYLLEQFEFCDMARRWSGWAASVPAAGSSCCSAVTTQICCSFR
jgi:hypothetical protein